MALARMRQIVKVFHLYCELLDEVECRLKAVEADM